MSQFFYSITLLTEARVGGFKVVFLVFFLRAEGRVLLGGCGGGAHTKGIVFTLREY